MERCEYAISYEPYDWCDLSDNPCIESNSDDVCENNTEREEG